MGQETDSGAAIKDTISEAQMGTPQNNHQDEVRRLTHNLERSDAQVLKLEEELTNKKLRLRDAREHIRDLETDVSRSRAEIDSLKTYCEGIKIRAREVEAQKRAADNELGNLQSLLSSTRELLNTRSAELRDAQTYLSSTDKLSHAEVLRNIHILNSEISQIAPRIADRFQCGDRKGGDIPRREQAIQRASVSLGSELVSTLSQVDHTEEPLALVIALQACLAAYCAWHVRRWTPTASEEVNALLDYIYTQISSHGEERQAFYGETALLILACVIEQQPVAGRWRALTRLHVDEAGGASGKSTDSFCDSLVDCILDILVVSGQSARPDELKLVMEEFKQPLMEVIRLAFTLRDAIGTGVVSSEFVLINPLPGMPFDTTSMQNQYTDKKYNPKDDELHATPTLCTVQLGLARWERQKGAERRTTVHRMEGIVVLKSEVALKTICADILAQQRTIVNAP